MTSVGSEFSVSYQLPSIRNSLVLKAAASRWLYEASADSEISMATLTKKVTAVEAKKSEDVKSGLVKNKPIQYPFWFGGSGSCFATFFTHPLDLGMLHVDILKQWANQLSSKGPVTNTSSFRRAVKHGANVWPCLQERRILRPIQGCK
jgi:hypothetical protein